MQQRIENIFSNINMALFFCTTSVLENPEGCPIANLMNPFLSYLDAEYGVENALLCSCDEKGAVALVETLFST